MKLKDCYDKLLHISITFVLMCFLCVWLPWYIAVMIMAILQVAKIVWNYHEDYWYHPFWDVMANLGGYALFVLYAVVR